MAGPVQIARFLSPTATGNQDFTAAALDSDVPTAVMVEVVGANSDGVAADHLLIGRGVTDGVSEYCVSGYDGHNLDSSSTNAGGAAATVFLRQGSTTLLQASFVSFIAGGVRLNFTTVDASTHFIKITFYLAENAKVGLIDPVTKDAEIDVTAPGFEPGVVLLSWVRRTDGASSNPLVLSHGFAVNDGVDTQQSFAMVHASSNDTTSIYARRDTSHAAARCTYAEARYLVSNFDSVGFSLTMENAGETLGDIVYLALDFGDLAVWGAALDSPTATGSWQVTSLPFEPGYVEIYTSMITATDSNKTDGTAGSFGFCGFTEAASYATALANEDNVDTSNTQSLSDDTAVHVTTDGGTQSFLASLTGMLSNGWDLNFTVADGTARKWFSWAVEGSVIAQDIQPYGKTSSVAFGMGVVRASQALRSSSLGSAIAMGLPLLTPQAVFLSPGGLMATSGFGAALIFVPHSHVLAPPWRRSAIGGANGILAIPAEGRLIVLAAERRRAKVTVEARTTNTRSF